MPIPFIIGAIIATKALGAAVDIAGQRRRAKGYEQEGNMEAQLFGRNAEIAEEMGRDAVARGREEELRQQFRIRTLTATQRSAFSGQGVDINVGSPRDVVQSDYRVGQFDALRIRENAAREALGFEHQAEIFRMQGEMARTVGRNKAKSARYESLSTLVNFGGDMFDLYKGSH